MPAIKAGKDTKKYVLITIFSLPVHVMFFFYFCAIKHFNNKYYGKF